MACCLLKRIPRIFVGSTICLLWIVLTVQNGVVHNNHRVDAFSLPQLQIATQRHPIHRQQQQQQQQQPNDHCQISQQPQNRPFHKKSFRKTDTICLFAALPFYATDVSGKNKDDKKNPSPPFLIESITSTPGSGDAIYKTIANLCIDVFFKELLDPSGKGNVNLLKAWQINYLKNLQTADLERRRNRCPDTNVMFLAYEVRKTRGTSEALSQPLLMDDELERAYNLNVSSNNDKSMDSSSYIRGDLLGFVEVTQRSYGLGNSVEGISFFNSEFQKRPVLTNLAVLKDSRKYGIGSKLLDRCEEYVLDEWNMKEIILEVEDYNGKGLEFYQKRGYEVLFSDPASRRYDIQGFWLNKVRCRRDIMRKGLDPMPGTNLMKSADGILRKLRDSVGSF